MTQANTNSAAASFYAEGREAQRRNPHGCVNHYHPDSFAGRSWEAGYMDAASRAQVERETMAAFRYSPCCDMQTRMTLNSTASR